MKHLFGNVYVGNPQPVAMLRQAKSHGCRTLALAEMYRFLGLSKTVLGDDYIATYGKGFEVDPNGRNSGYSSPVFVRKPAKIVLQMSVKVCEAAEPLKIAPPRVLNIAGIQEPDGHQRAILNFHPHAGVNDIAKNHPNSNNDRWLEYKSSVMTLQDILLLLEKWGFSIVGGIDLNYLEGGPRLQGTPYWLFDKMGFKYINRGIDGVFWSNDLKLVDEPKWIEDNVTKSDHPWAIVNLDYK